MPRRTVCTPKKRTQLLEAIAQGKRIELAAAAAGVSRRTAFTWKSEDPSLAAEWNEAYDSATDKLEDVLYQKALDGDLGSLIFALRSRMPAKYNPALIARLEMLALAKAKAIADGGNGMTIESNVASRPQIYPVQARLEMPRLLGQDDAADPIERVDCAEDDTDQEDVA